MVAFLAGAALGAAAVLLADKKKVSALLDRVEKAVVGKSGDEPYGPDSDMDEAPGGDYAADEANPGVANPGVAGSDETNPGGANPGGAGPEDKTE